jgi:hypothetical protein
MDLGKLIQVGGTATAGRPKHAPDASWGRRGAWAAGPAPPPGPRYGERRVAAWASSPGRRRGRRLSAGTCRDMLTVGRNCCLACMG